MPLVFRDAVFIDDWDQLAGRAVGVPHGGERAVLELRKYSLKLDLLVLRIVTRYGGLSDKMSDDSIFRYCFQRIVLNARFYGELIIRALRRAVANRVT